MLKYDLLVNKISEYYKDWKYIKMHYPFWIYDISDFNIEIKGTSYKEFFIELASVENSTTPNVSPLINFRTGLSTGLDKQTQNNLMVNAKIRDDFSNIDTIVEKLDDAILNAIDIYDQWHTDSKEIGNVYKSIKLNSKINSIIENE